MKKKKQEYQNYELSRKIIEKASIHYDKGELDEACRLYEEAFNYYVAVSDVLEYAMIKLEQGDNEKALELVNGVIELHPDDFRGYYFKGVYHEFRNEDEEALTQFLKAEELIAKEDLGKDEALLYFKIGRTYDDLSDKYKDKKDEYIKRAKDYYRKTLELDNEFYYANLNLGSIYEKENMLDDALKLMLLANKTEPDEKMSAYNLGVIYAKLGDYDNAIKYYKEEISKEDFYPFAYYNLGIIYKDVYKDYVKAKEYYIDGLKYLKDNASLWYNLGCVYVLLNDFTNATDCFYYAISLKNDIFDYMVDDKEISTYVINKEYNILQNRIKSH